MTRALLATLFLTATTLPPQAHAQQTGIWLTTPDKTSLLAEQPKHLVFTSRA